MILISRAKIGWSVASDTPGHTPDRRSRSYERAGDHHWRESARGIGKELAAHAIHDRPPRRNRPYVAINCAAVAERLIESELFGHERGAFTGADRRREGCFERANGGSLLLDEITEMRPEMQAKLLRVLEEKRILRLGASRELQIDVRVFAASNRSLHQSIRQGRLREDLYYRLNVYTVELPPLRDRLEDLPLLVGHFIQEFNREYKKRVQGMGQDCLDALRAHAWPGTFESCAISSNAR